MSSPRFLPGPDDVTWWTGLRNPLARIEIAASRLGRESQSPGARDWVDSIRESVVELDQAIAAMIPWEPRNAARTPLPTVLDDVVARLQPAFQARGAELVALQRAGPDPTPQRWRARRAALALLRCAARSEPEQIAISACHHSAPSLWGIEVRWRGGQTSAEHRDLNARDPLRRVCLECRASLEFGPGTLRLWFEAEPLP